jgi:hypothetical protein
MAQKSDFTELFRNAGHTGRISNILKKLCGIKGQARIDPSS